MVELKQIAEETLLYAYIPYTAVKDENLTADDAVLLGVMIGKLDKKQEYLFEDMNMLTTLTHRSEQEIKNSLSRLKDGGYIIFSEIFNSSKRIIIINFIKLIEDVQEYGN